MWDWLNDLLGAAGTWGGSAVDWLSSPAAASAGKSLLGAVGPAVATAGMQALTRPSAPEAPRGGSFMLPTQTASGPPTQPLNPVEPNLYGAPPQNVPTNAAGLNIDDRLRRQMQRRNGFEQGV